MRRDKLVKELNNPDHANVRVYLARDPEGNGFYQVYEVAYYTADEASEFLEEVVNDPVIVLWP